MTQRELRTILAFAPPRPGHKSSLRMAYGQTWRSLIKKGLVVYDLVSNQPELTRAGEDMLAWMLGEYTIIPEKVGRA